ncbi:MAG: alpha/beta hydrolase [Wenzhouxiangellaceae bacterium]|nr:alpha/beta hydrolase [Wenzhouxiangellaceae bacterium]
MIKSTMPIETITLTRQHLAFPARAAGRGPPVLLLHGFPDCHQNWLGQIEALAAAGYRAVAPALRGYHPHCQPGNKDYSLAAAVDDVCHFAESLGGPVHLVGHDWGAVVAWLAAAAAPERIRSCTALAVPPLRHLSRAMLKRPRQWLRSSYMAFFQIPALPEWWLCRNDGRGLETLWQRWSPGLQAGEHLERARQAFAQAGVASAAVGWYRHLPRAWSRDHRRARQWLARPVRVPSLSIHGADDRCIDPALVAGFDRGDFPTGLRVEIIDQAGHFVHLEQPGVVNRLLCEHFSAC